MRRVLFALRLALVTTVLAAGPLQAAQPPQPPTGQSEFVPMKDLPPTEQIPAATLLVAGYSFIWIAVAVYVWTIWRRLNRVEAEMRALAQKTPQR